MVGVELHGIAKTFRSDGKDNHVLAGLDLVIAAGEVVAIRGDNGLGKTTLLNIIAGVEQPSAGAVSFKAVDRAVPRIGYTQQDYTSSLLPWLNVAENIAIPLRIRGVGAKERRERAEQIVGNLGFNNLPLANYPWQLSGGQKQRVAVARSVVHQPHLLLLDEPFANLDAHTSRDLQQAISRIHDRDGPTILYVSHELDHCIYLSDRVLLLHGSPAKVVGDFKIKLPRPRTREMIFTATYEHARSEILAKEEELYARRK